MSMLKSVVFPADWTTIPFGRVAPRVQDSGRPDLESLSVFLGAGVVPRSSREDNHNQLGEDMGKYLVVKPGDIVFNKLNNCPVEVIYCFLVESRVFSRILYVFNGKKRQSISILNTKNTFLLIKTLKKKD